MATDDIFSGHKFMNRLWERNRLELVFEILNSFAEIDSEAFFQGR